MLARSILVFVSWEGELLPALAYLWHYRVPFVFGLDSKGEVWDYGCAGVTLC